MDACALFLLEHARSHSAIVAPDGGPLWLGDTVLTNLTDDDIRRRPGPGQNSIAWLLWHITRIEDVAIGVVLGGRGQVLHEAGWLALLGITEGHVGSGMAEAEVDALSARIDITALRAYRAAVGRQTRTIVAALSGEHWDAAITGDDVKRAIRDDAFGSQAGWLEPFWIGRSKAWLLSWTGAGHSTLHLGEAMLVRGQLGRSLNR